MTPFTVYGIAAAVIFALGGFTGYRATSTYYRAEIADAKVAHQVALDKANVNADAAAELYEAERAKQRIKVVTVTERVSNALATEPVWAAASLPAGVRDAIRTARPHPCEPDGTLHIPATGDCDQRPTGSGLLSGAGRLRGLFGAAPGAE